MTSEPHDSRLQTRQRNFIVAQRLSLLEAADMPHDFDPGPAYDTAIGAYQQQGQGGRGTGTTAEQMREAPKNAVFVVHPGIGAATYCRELARHIGRGDLEIQPSYWLKGHRWRGRHFTGIVIDHVVMLSEAELRGYEEVVARVRPERTDG